MASGFLNGGTDLDSILAPYHAGMPQAPTTGFEVNGGVDLNQRYAPLSQGAQGAATGFETSGQDLNAIFAAFGSTFLFNGSIVAGQFVTNNPPQLSTSSGYQQRLLGSISGGGALTGGQAIIELSDNQIMNENTGQYIQQPSLGLEISGFSSDPGASFFSTLSINGTLYSSAAAQYGYGSGIAGWIWAGAPYPFNNGGTYPVTIAP